MLLRLFPFFLQLLAYRFKNANWSLFYCFCFDLSLLLVLCDDKSLFSHCNGLRQSTEQEAKGVASNNFICAMFFSNSFDLSLILSLRNMFSSCKEMKIKLWWTLQPASSSVISFNESQFQRRQKVSTTQIFAVWGEHRHYLHDFEKYSRESFSLSLSEGEMVRAIIANDRASEWLSDDSSQPPAIEALMEESLWLTFYWAVNSITNYVVISRWCLQIMM